MKKIFILGLVLGLCWTGGAWAQALLAVQNVKGRTQMSLDGMWKYAVDPYGHGGYKGNGGFGRDRHFDGSQLQDYDFDTSDEIRVPGDWNTQKEKLYYYEGTVWYRTRFDGANRTDGMRQFLHFGAVNYEAVVWLNGKMVGSHVGGYTPFEIEVTGKLKERDNSLVVRVNNTRLPEGIPTMNTDWWNYGGITRSVSLVEVPETYVKDYTINISKDRKWIEGSVQLADAKAGMKVTVEIPELKLKQSVNLLDDSGLWTFAYTAPKKLRLWTPESPKLYDVVISTETETVKDRIGFRTIETEGQKILLNGEEVFLAGVNIHEEGLGDHGRVTTREEDSLLLTMAKDLGCNFVRLAHYPHNEDMTRLADEMGLMVWSEIPLYWGIQWTNEKTYENAQNQLREMIGRDHNRCSIIIWSIANETAVRPERTAFLTKLAGEARGLDGTRLISAALQNVNKRLTPTTYTVEDPLGEALDLFSFNEYIGWYDAKKEFCDSITWQLSTTKPVVISEFGAGARIGRHSGPDAYFSEDNMESVYRHQFVMLDKIPGLAGTIPWVLKDFRSPHRLLVGIQDDYNRKGLYSEKGEKKQAWKVVREWNVRKREQVEWRALLAGSR